MTPDTSSHDPELTASGSYIIHLSAILWLFLVISAFGFVGKQLSEGVRLESDLLKLLPSSEQSRKIDRATAVFLQEVSQRLLVLFRAESFEESVKAAQQFKDELDDQGVFARIDLKQKSGIQGEFHNLYYPYRSGLYSNAIGEFLDGGSPAEAAARRVYQILSSPLSGGVGRYLSEDPFLLYSDFLSTLRKAAPSMSVRGGYLTAMMEGNEYVVLQGVLKDNVFNREFQKEAAEKISAAQKRVEAEGNNREVLPFGAIQFASEMAGQAEHDVFFISIGSMLGIAILLLFVFRSPLPFLVTTGTIAGGLAVAFSASVLCFESMHAIALAFGASLIGVCSDYSLHYFCHRQHEPGVRSEKIVKAVLPGITLGMLTTALGYFALFSVPFPGLYQMAFFSVVGMVSTYLSVVLLYRYLPMKIRQENEPGMSPGGIYFQWARWFWKGRFGKVAVCLLVMLVVAGASRIQVNDNVRELQKPPSHLLEAEARVAQVSGGIDKGRFVLTCGKTDEQLLSREEQARITLDRLIKEGKLSNYQAISRYVPSASLQRSRAEKLRATVASHKEQFQVEFENIGYDPVPLRSALQKIEQTEALPLLLPQWSRSVVSEPLRFLYMPISEEERCSIMLLQGQISQDIFDALEFDVEEVVTVDLVRDSTRVLKMYRESATVSIAFCYLLVALVLMIRYGIKRGVLALLPAVAAFLVTLSLYGLLGIPVTLFSVLANAIVLGLAVDYSIFLLEGAREQRAVLMAILLSGLSSILSFGLLGVSSAAVLRSFGLTLFSGVLVAMLVAPVLIFLDKRCDE